MKIQNQRNDEKYKLFKQDILDEKVLKSKIKEFCYTEYDELLQKILILDEVTFFLEFEQNVNKQIEVLYTDKALTNKIIMNLVSLYKKSIHKNYYLSDYKINSKAWSDYQANLDAIKNLNPRLAKKNTECFSYLNKYFEHCSACNNKDAIHSCGEKLLEVYNENESKDSKKQTNLLFVICVGCKTVFTRDCILLYCNACNLNYYSRAMFAKEMNEEYLYSSWEKYHCNTIVKDPMKCIKCQNVFYYSKKRNNLLCKSCKFETKPNNISWQCIVCKADFKSGAKNFCFAEFKIVRDSIKKSLIEKVKSIPDSVPCCNLNVDITEFIHKKECNGILLDGELNGEKIIVCEKCKAMNFYDKFIWTCPTCFKKFRQKASNEITSEKGARSVSTNVNLPISAVSTPIVNESKKYSSNFSSNKPRSISINNINCIGGAKNIEEVEIEKNLSKKFDFDNINLNSKNDSEKNSSTNLPQSQNPSQINLSNLNIQLNLPSKDFSSPVKQRNSIMNSSRNQTSSEKNFALGAFKKTKNLMDILEERKMEKGIFHSRNISYHVNSDKDMHNNTVNDLAQIKNYNIKNYEQDEKKEENKGSQYNIRDKKFSESISPVKSKKDNMNHSNSVFQINPLKKETSGIVNYANNPSLEENKELLPHESILEESTELDSSDGLKSKNLNCILKKENEVNHQNQNIVKKPPLPDSQRKVSKDFEKDERKKSKETKESKESKEINSFRKKNSDSFANEQQKGIKEDSSNLKIVNKPPITPSINKEVKKIEVDNNKNENKKVIKQELKQKQEKQEKEKKPEVPSTTSPNLKNKQVQQTQPQPKKESVDFDININEYKIIQQIGEGTYGKIYKVINKQGKKFAMKKIICHDKTELRLTKTEFQIVMKNQHENILKIEGMSEKILDETTFALYILLELADNDWENEVSKRAKTLKFYKESELMDILRQLVSCLAFLQKNKISHRDIKPQNILVFKSTLFKLGDFGEAKETNIKTSGTLRGTELYMSPILFEKLREENMINPNSTAPKSVKHNLYKSDMFSLGYCMIYAATLTFDSIGSLREVYEIRDIEKILKNWFRKRYSDKFIKIVLRMIELDETKRFDFLELEEILNKEIESNKK